MGEYNAPISKPPATQSGFREWESVMISNDPNNWSNDDLADGVEGRAWVAAVTGDKALSGMLYVAAKRLREKGGSK